jgi:ribosomal protein S27E
MAIEFNCPHCKTHYRLKDEFGGKTATCKNPNCRKVIPIPKPSGNGRAGAPVDVDALAAAAFSDEPAMAAMAEEMIPVTCSGCDHAWSVEASKEGKNVRCPECGKVVRVAPRKKEEKADWRSGGGGPSLAKRETGLDREGAFGNVAATGISAGTAREIVKGREAEEEPEERRKRLIKRGVLGILVLAVLGVGGYFALKTKREMTSDANMADAVKELADRGKDSQGKIDPRLDALIHRASAEYRGRTSGSESDAAETLKDIKIARNRAKDARTGKGSSQIDADGIQADVAETVPLLLGVGEEADRSPKKSDLVKELRQSLQDISDPDLAAEAVRTATRRAAAKDQPTFVEEATQNLPPELTAQVGLELLRINREKYKADAEGVLKKLGNADTPGVQAMRAFFGKTAAPKKDGEPPPAPPLAAQAEADAIKGDIAKAKAVRNVPKAEDRAKAIVAVAYTLGDANPGEAGPLLTEAAKILKDVKGSVSPWVSVRACELMAKLGQDAEAESLAASLPDEATKAWGRLAVLRGRLEALKGKKSKGDDSWLDAVGDPTKSAAAAKAREVMARHNAADGFAGEYGGVVKKWPGGTVRPFGTAGIVLGQLDRREQK